jgi:hypothetical protein
VPVSQTLLQQSASRAHETSEQHSLPHSPEARLQILLQHISSREHATPSDWQAELHWPSSQKPQQSESAEHATPSPGQSAQVPLVSSQKAPQHSSLKLHTSPYGRHPSEKSQAPPVHEPLQHSASRVQSPMSSVQTEGAHRPVLVWQLLLQHSPLLEQAAPSSAQPAAARQRPFELQRSLQHSASR